MHWWYVLLLFSGSINTKRSILELSETIAQPVFKLCSELHCLYGAKCQQKGPQAQCMCDFNCEEEDGKRDDEALEETAVCGSDGNSYSSDCQLRLYSCRIQESVLPVHNGLCKGEFKH